MERRARRGIAIRNLFVASCACTLLLLTATPRLHAQDGGADSQASVLSLRDYEAALARYSTLIKQSQNQPDAIEGIRDSLPYEWTVRAGGTDFTVSTGWLDSALGQLQGHPKNADALERDIELGLAEMQRQATELEKPRESVAESTARARLETIFQAREFEGLQGPSALQRLERRIEDWVAAHLIRLLRRLHITKKTGNFLAWGVILLAFAAIAYWAIRVISRRTRTSELPVVSPVGPSDTREWVEEALAAAERGEYREAVHRAYWAAIARLEDLKLLSRDRSRTPRESLRLLDEHPREQSSLRDLTVPFELIWYGYRPASQSDWRGVRTQLEKFGCLKASIAPTANS